MRCGFAPVTSFGECVRAGNAILESYPAMCVSKEGKTFTQDIGNELEKRGLIRLAVPRPNERVASPLVVAGEARGVWFFEGSFPVAIFDDSGNEIASGIATAGSDPNNPRGAKWMTEEFVPFSAEVQFDAKGAKSGFVVLKKDNPSGLPEHDDALRIPVTFE